MTCNWTFRAHLRKQGEHDNTRLSSPATWLKRLAAMGTVDQGLASL
jgi:hypothetical protein